MSMELTQNVVNFSYLESKLKTKYEETKQNSLKNIFSHYLKNKIYIPISLGT